MTAPLQGICFVRRRYYIDYIFPTIPYLFTFCPQISQGLTVLKEALRFV